MKRSRRILQRVFEENENADSASALSSKEPKINILENRVIKAAQVHVPENLENNPGPSYHSPGTGKCFAVLENAKINSHIGLASRSDSFSDISISSLVPPLEGPLAENYIEQFLRTPKRLRFVYHSAMPSTSRQHDGRLCTDENLEISERPSATVEYEKNYVQPMKFSVDRELQPQLPPSCEVVEDTVMDSDSAKDFSDDDDSDYSPSSSSDVSFNSNSTDESDVSESNPCHIQHYNVDAPSAHQIQLQGEWIDIDAEAPKDIPNFTSKLKTNIPVDVKAPFDIYKLFVTDDIINKMVIETNNYAEKYIRKELLKRTSRLKNWRPTDHNEMSLFMGIMVTMGLVKLPSIYNYWSTKSCYRNEYICSLMSRDRFILLLKFWHFSDENSIASESDKLAKIRCILEMMLVRFSEILEPGKFLIIDETMIPWRGRLKFRQYIKNKSNKYGIKLFKLCTPEGYTVAIIVYTGKLEKSPQKGIGQTTVMKLINGFEKEGRVIIADNYYTSVELAEELLKKKMMLCGTIRTNRKRLPKVEVIHKKIKRGQVVGKMTKGGVKIIKWHDKRPVTMISSCPGHTASVINTGKNNKYTNEPIMKPSCITMYNENKKGVDFSDQMTAYYSSLKRGVKWYRKLMMSFLFGTCMVNAWIVHNNINENKMNLLKFSESIVQGLTRKEFKNQKVSEAKGKKIHTFDKQQKRRRCVLCYQEFKQSMTSRNAEKKAKQVNTICVECEKPMCLNCFNKFHQNIDVA